MKMNTYDILVVGDLNVDIIMDNLNKPPQFGQEQHADEMNFVLGSSSAIFASNSSSLGSKVAFCGKLGNDTFGKFIIQTLQSKKVNTDSIILESGLKTGATIICNDNNERMMVTYPGAMEHLRVDEIPTDLINRSRHLHTSAIFFLPEIKNNLATLFTTAKEAGLTTSLDPQWDPYEKWDLNLNELLPLLDFFLPNELELLKLTKATTVESALDQLSGNKTCIIVKQGTEGATLQHNDKRISVPAYHVPNFTDAIGAGDSFNAGFIHAYLAGKSLDDCLIEGNLTAAISTQSSGGTEGIINYKHVIQQGQNLKLSSSIK